MVFDFWSTLYHNLKFEKKSRPHLYENEGKREGNVVVSSSEQTPEIRSRGSLESCSKILPAGCFLPDLELPFRYAIYSEYRIFIMPSIIQTAFFIEALVNVPAIVSLIFYPESVLRPAITTDSISPAAQLNRTSTLIVRCAGVLIFSLTPQLLLAIPDSKDCAGKRKQAYLTLGCGEGGLIALFLWEAFRERSPDELGGLTRTAALLCVGMLFPLWAWRVFVYRWKEHWFSPEGGRGGERKNQ